MIAPVLLGAAAGLDRTAFGQTLLAHPFVAGCLAGLLAGVPLGGVQAGLVAWMLSAPRVPVGETRVRDWTSAVIAMPWCVPDPASDAAWGLTLGVAVLTAVVGGMAIDGVRMIASRAIEQWRHRPAALRSRPARLHVALTALHALRGATVVVLAVVLGRAFVAALLGMLPDGVLDVFARVWVLAPLGLLPLLWRVHGDLGRARASWIAMASTAVLVGVVRWMAGGGS